MNVDSEVRKLKERHSPLREKRVREEQISEEDARIIEEIDLHSADEAVRQYEQTKEQWRNAHQQDSMAQTSKAESMSTEEHARELRNQRVLTIHLGA